MTVPEVKEIKTLKQHLKIFQFLNQQDEGKDWYYIHDIMKAVNSFLKQFIYPDVDGIELETLHNISINEILEKVK